MGRLLRAAQPSADTEPVPALGKGLKKLKKLKTFTAEPTPVAEVPETVIAVPARALDCLAGYGPAKLRQLTLRRAKAYCERRNLELQKFLSDAADAWLDEAETSTHETQQ